MGSRTENTLCVNYYLPMLRTDICSGAWNFLLLSLDSTLRNPFKQVSSSFFLWATSGQGELLTARTGNWNSEGKVAITHDRVGRGNTIREVKPAAVCPGPPGCPQIRSCCLYHFRLLHTEGQLAEASPHWGSPMLRGPHGTPTKQAYKGMCRRGRSMFSARQSFSQGSGCPTPALSWGISTLSRLRNKRPVALGLV